MAKKQRVRWNTSKSALENARLALPRLGSRYLKAARKLSAGNPSPKAVRRFRLETNRFRDTLELFRGCCGRSLNTHLEALNGIQSDLGEINDCLTTRQLLSDRKGIPSAEQDRISNLLDKRIATKTADLLQHVGSTLLVPGQKQLWTQDLGAGKKAAPLRRREPR